MERYGVVLVAAFAAGMFAGPLFCVIYSRFRQTRKLQPGPRQLKSAQRQLVSLAECSTRLGAQKWEMAIATSSGAVGADDQAGPRPGRWLRGSEPGSGEQEEDGIGHPHRPRGGAGDDAGASSLDCPICIGPLFPQGRDNGEEASDNRLSAAYASSTQAYIDRDTSNAVADGERVRWWIATWRTWSRSLRRQPRAASSTSPPPQPEMSSARQGWDGRQDSLAWGVESRGGEALDPQGGDGEGSRVQNGDPEKMACSRGSDHDDTPDSTTTTVEGGAAPRRRDDVMTTSPRSGAEAGAVPGWATGGSQDGNVLEGIHDSDAKTMTPVYLATSSTGSQSPAPAPSAGVGGGDAKSGRLDTQPLAGHAAALTAPGDGEAARSPPQSSDRRAVGARDDVQTTTTLAGSTESGRVEPSTISAARSTHPDPTVLNTPRRPANAVVRASRAAVALMGNLSPSSRRARAVASSHGGAGHGRDHEHDGDEDSNNGTSDIDTDILVLRGCQHAFHARCLVTWFLADGFDCPVCRTPYWMHRERLARALQNERNGLPLNHNEEQFQARARAHWTVASPSVYSAMGSAFVVVRTPGRPVYATDRRPWEVYIP